MSGLVSVVLPCYQAERYLPAALDSILEQTRREIEVVAVDDGSSDGTAGILARRAAADARLRVVTHGRNRGVISTLNRGVQEARGAYIARMDADDVALPRRLERQVEVLEQRPEIDALGSSVELIDEAGRVVGRRPVRCREPEGARFLGLFATPITHPTLLARTEVMRRFPYREDEACLHAEDYDLFARMLRGGAALANLEAPLLRFRINPEGVSRRHERIQVENFTRLARAHLERETGASPRPGVHRALVNRIDDEVGAGDLVGALQLLGRLEREHRERAGTGSDAAREIWAIGHQQRLDILVQAMGGRGAGRRLVAAALLAGRLPALRHADVRRYVAAKLGWP